MIWRLRQVDDVFRTAFISAGMPDQQVIDEYLARTGKQNAPPKHVGVQRWYYLLQENGRIRLTTIGMPLTDWMEEGKILVGTNEIIGEFEGNRAFVGYTGLQLQMQPIAWLQGEADKEFSGGAALLAEISEQILDRSAIERTQATIAQKYRHPPKRSTR